MDLQRSHNKVMELSQGCFTDICSFSYEIILSAKWNAHDGNEVEWHFTLQWEFHTMFSLKLILMMNL